MKPALIIVGLPVCGAFAASVLLLAKEKTTASLLQLLGAGFLVVVVLSHVAEGLHLLPSMGWGLPNSPGHYIDLVAAAAGLILFLAGYLSRSLAKFRMSR